MVYKVAEVVKELGVSRQTVYKKLRRDNFKEYIVDLDGSIGVTEEGLQVLKDIQCKGIEEVEECKHVSKEDTGNSVTALQKELIENLNRQIDSYEEQLKVKDKQLEEKDKQIAELIKVTENGQVLQKMILSNTEVKLLAYREELEIRRNESIKENKQGIMGKIKRIFESN